MATASDIHRFIDEADVCRKELGEYRMMVMRAHGILLRIQNSPKNKPTWIEKELVKVQEALTLELRN